MQIAGGDIGMVTSASRVQADEVVEASPDEICRASLLSSPQDVIAVYEIPQYTVQPTSLSQQLVLALDTVQDPGNLGTIVRIADWYGIEHILCSPLCADLYNPKVVQATMGALARVQIHYVELVDFLPQIKAPIYGTFLDGENIYTQSLTPSGIIVMGNEGNGISPEIRSLVTHTLFLPSYPKVEQRPNLSMSQLQRQWFVLSFVVPNKKSPVIFSGDFLEL